MITLIENLPDNIIGYKYDGDVTAADYETVLFPAVETAAKKGRDLKVLCQLGDNFKGFKLGALKDDMEIGFKYLKSGRRLLLYQIKSG